MMPIDRITINVLFRKKFFNAHFIIYYHYLYYLFYLQIGHLVQKKRIIILSNIFIS